MNGSSISNSMNLLGSELAFQGCRQSLMRLTIPNRSPHNPQSLDDNYLFAQDVFTIANQRNILTFM